MSCDEAWLSWKVALEAAWNKDVWVSETLDAVSQMSHVLMPGGKELRHPFCTVAAKSASSTSRLQPASPQSSPGSQTDIYKFRLLHCSK